MPGKLDSVEFVRSSDLGSMVGIAQLVRVPGCGPGGRGFESHYSPHPLPAALGCGQAVKATDFDSVIRRFKSCHPSHSDPLAQSVEHLTFNQGVRSSNLRRVTNVAFTGVRAWRNWQTRQI